MWSTRLPDSLCIAARNGSNWEKRMNALIRLETRLNELLVARGAVWSAMGGIHDTCHGHRHILLAMHIPDGFPLP